MLQLKKKKKTLHINFYLNIVVTTDLGAMCIDELLQFSCISAREIYDTLGILEVNESWHAGDILLGSNVLVFVDIDLFENEWN